MWRKNMSKLKTISKALVLLRYGVFFKGITYALKKDKKYKELNPVEYLNWAGSHRLNYKVDVLNPRSMNEKINWLKLFYRNPLWYEVTDKLKAKEYAVEVLKEAGIERPEQYLPKTYQVVKQCSELNLEALPNKFVLKTNNDSGSVFICEKGKTNFEEIFKKLDISVKHQYSSGNYEWIYDKIENHIFAEEYLEPFEGNDLFDYKMQIFNDKFGYCLLCSNRAKNIKMDFFDENYNHLPISKGAGHNKKNEAVYDKPKQWEEMLKISKILGKQFPLLRVDFYNTSEGIKLGELTLFGGSGFSFFHPKQYDFFFGSMIELPKPNFNLDLFGKK